MMRNRYTDRGDHYAVELWRRYNGKQTYSRKHQLFALIDKADLPLVEAINGTWLAVKGGRTHYARTVVTTNGNRRILWMHRVILACSDDLEADHGNHDGLDNRRNNLAAVTHEFNTSKGRRRQPLRSKPKATLCGKCHKFPRMSNYAYCELCKSNYECDRRARIKREREVMRQTLNWVP